MALCVLIEDGQPARACASEAHAEREIARRLKKLSRDKRVLAAVPDWDHCGPVPIIRIRKTMAAMGQMAALIADATSQQPPRSMKISRPKTARMCRAAMRNPEERRLRNVRRQWERARLTLFRTWKLWRDSCRKVCQDCGANLHRRGPREYRPVAVLRTDGFVLCCRTCWRLNNHGNKCDCNRCARKAMAALVGFAVSARANGEAVEA